MSIKRSIVLKQIIVGFTDWAVAGLVLYLFLPEKPDFFLFLGIFCLAQFAGVVSNLPGGIGTFEFVFINLLGSSNGILAAIFLYRVVYYLVPLIGAIITYIIMEFTSKTEKIARTYEFLVPVLLAAFCFTSGIILLVSGSIPPAISRITFLEKIIPLGVLEISHFLGSIVGIVLILLSYAIKNRINLAYRISICTLILGIFSLLFKGAGYGTASVLLLVLILLIPSKKFFYRKSSLFHNGINLEWTVLIVMVLISSIWLGLFSYNKTPYSDLLWWQFEFHKGAPRVLRAIFAIGLFTFIFSIIKILRPVTQEKYTCLNDSKETVDEIMRDSSDSESNLVYLNDKRIYFSDNKKAFIMYGKYQNTRIVMGDPVGDENEISEIIWDYYLDTKNSLESIIFYEVGKENLHYYLDIGLTILKIGEEALVNLGDFSLKGDKKKTLRYTYNKLTKEEYEIKIIKKEEIEPYLDELERISDIWLETKKVREKSFSLGNFTKEYMRNFDTAVITKDNEIYAFANLFYSGDKNEISIDLMRYDVDKAPNGIMDFLFMKIMEYGKENGYKYFNLGMAPLSGIEDRNTGLVNLWNKAGIFIYKHGNHFYNFEGLKKFKNKFDPEWKPKYVAFYGNPFKIVSNTVSLISGGMKGFFKK
nr:bifunctional lysylphosphatidylglycerol flippase/synthetase MprF [Sebaldella sp. S0638]